VIAAERRTTERSTARNGHSLLQDKAAILEKLEQAPWFTVAHVRAERGAHRNLTEIKVFALKTSFNYGSTAIVETL
jgi:hypothetical protein